MLSDKIFAWFEAERAALPIALFRIVFFASLAVHFMPAMLAPDGEDIVRTSDWWGWLHAWLRPMPPSLHHLLTLVTLMALGMGVLALWTRAAAAISGVCLFIWANHNGLHVQTLALTQVWAILLLWALLGGGDSALSISAMAGRELKPRREREPGLLPALITLQLLIAVFFSGVEKLLAGWPSSNEMQILFSYPKGSMVRDWALDLELLRSSNVSAALSWATLLIELGVPLCMLIRRTRWFAWCVYQVFFATIVATLEVPPLFYTTFAVGGLLVIDWPRAMVPPARTKRSRGFVSREAQSHVIGEPAVRRAQLTQAASR